MKPCKIWVEQCDATKAIEVEFGTDRTEKGGRNRVSVRRHSDSDRRTQHDAVLVKCLGGDHRRELDHQPRPRIQLAVAEHFIEGKVVKDFDEFWIR